MRTLWIGLLSRLARSLQTWSEAVTRRLERVRRSATGAAGELAISDQPSSEVDGPPADWLERVKSAQPPAHWRAKVQAGRSDSIKSVEPSMLDVHNESTPADRPIEPQRSEASAVAAPPLRASVQPLSTVRPPSQPNYQAADTTRTKMQAASDQPSGSTQTIDQSPPLPVHEHVVAPAKSAATRSPVKSVRSTLALHSTHHVPAREADPITPEVEATAQSDEVVIDRSQPPALQRERRFSMQVSDDARAHPTTTERGVEDQTLTDQLAYTERDVPAPDQSQRAQRIARSQPRSASRTQSVAPVDVMSPIESHTDQVAVTPSPTMSPPSRLGSAINDRVTASWPVDNTLRSTQTWAIIAGQSDTRYESSAIENRWPALPPERVTVAEDFESVLRERERLRRLDLEQRGLGWSA